MGRLTTRLAEIERKLGRQNRTPWYMSINGGPFTADHCPSFATVEEVHAAYPGAVCMSITGLITEDDNEWVDDDGTR